MNHRFGKTPQRAQCQCDSHCRKPRSVWLQPNFQYLRFGHSQLSALGHMNLMIRFDDAQITINITKFSIFFLLFSTLFFFRKFGEEKIKMDKEKKGDHLATQTTTTLLLANMK